MGCCDVLLKAILTITNVVVMVAGAVLLVAGGIFYTKKFDFFEDLSSYSTNVNSVLVPMMVIGGILFLVGTIGCCGAVTGKTGLLNVYFIIVLVVVILELVVIVLGVVKKKDFIETTEGYAKELFDKYKAKYVNGGTTEMAEAQALAVNTAQFLFECCGLTTGPEWWGAPDGKVPNGCCSSWNGEDMNEKLTTCETDKVYQEGCTEKVTALADEFGTVIIIVIVVVIVFELICLAAACYSKKNDMVA